jgi:hypothetical protein
MRHAIRSLSRAPWYALSVTGVIALGLALTTTVFAVVDGTLFKPLPYQDAERLFAVAAGHSALLPAAEPRMTALAMAARLRSCSHRPARRCSSSIASWHSRSAPST